MKNLANYLDFFISPVTGRISSSTLLPNLTSGHIWIGDSSNRPVESNVLLNATFLVEDYHSAIPSARKIEDTTNIKWTFDDDDKTAEAKLVGPIDVDNIPLSGKIKLSNLPILKGDELNGGNIWRGKWVSGLPPFAVWETVESNDLTELELDVRKLWINLFVVENNQRVQYAMITTLIGEMYITQGEIFHLESVARELLQRVTVAEINIDQIQKIIAQQALSINVIENNVSILQREVSNIQTDIYEITTEVSQNSLKIDVIDGELSILEGSVSIIIGTTIRLTGPVSGENEIGSSGTCEISTTLSEVYTGASTVNYPSSIVIGSDGRITSATAGSAPEGGTVTSVAVTGSTGLTVGGSPITTSGTITLTLGTELQGLSALSTTGLVVRTASGSYTARTIQGVTNQISVSNGNGVSSNPAIGIASNPVIPGTGSMTVPTGTTAQKPAVGAGKLRFNSDTGLMEYSNASAWNSISITTGTVTSVAIAGSTGLGVSGSPITTSGTITLTLGTELQGLSGLASDGIVVRSGAGSYSGLSLTDGQILIGSTGSAPVATTPTDGTNISWFTGPGTLQANLTGPIDTSLLASVELQGLAALSANGILARTTTGTYTSRTITGTANQITVTNGDGVSGNPTIFIPANPVFNGTAAMTIPDGNTAARPTAGSGKLRFNIDTNFLEYSSASTWYTVSTTTGTVTSVAVTGSTGLTVGGSPITTSGTITLTLGTELQGLSSLSATGLVSRTATGTYTSRTITGTTNQITVTNGDGVSADPILAIASNPVIPGTGSMTVPTGTAAQQPAVGAGKLRFNSDTGLMEYSNASAWNSISITTGTVTSVAIAGSTGLGVSGSPITSSGTITLTLGTELQGLSGLSANGVVIRTGSGAYATQALTNGQLLIGSTGAAPVAAVPTNGTNISWTTGAGSLTANLTGQVAVSNGGSGRSSVTAYGLLCGGTTTTGALQTVGPASSGQILMAQGTSALPAFVSQTSITSLGTITTGEWQGTPIATSYIASVELQGLAALSANGILARTTTGTYTSRTITGTANQITVTNGDGVSGNPTIFIPANPVFNGTAAMTIPDGNTAARPTAGSGKLRFNIDTNFLEYSSASTWYTVSTTTGTVTSVAVTGSTGLTVGGSPITTSGTITLTLGTELQGLSSLSATGLVSRTATGTYTSRTITGTTNQITVTNGDGVSGNPTISITSNPVIPGTGSITIPTGTTAEKPSVGAGQLRFNSTTGLMEYSNASAWNSLLTGIVTVSSGGTGLSSTTAYGVLCGGTTNTGALQNAGTGAVGTFLTGNGSSALPSWETAVTSVRAGYGLLSSTGTDIETTGTIYMDLRAVTQRAYCVAATTANLNATYDNGSSGVNASLTNAGASVEFSVDGVTFALLDRVLVKDQTNAAHNGIYIITDLGSGARDWVLNRATDFDGATAGGISHGVTVWVAQGTSNANTIWTQTTNAPFTMGTTAITFAGYGGQSSITQTGTLATFKTDGQGGAISGTQISLGTVYQNTSSPASGYMVSGTINVSSATSATITVGTGPTNTPTQRTYANTFSTASTMIIPFSFYVPYGYYFRVDKTGTITASVTNIYTPY